MKPVSLQATPRSASGRQQIKKLRKNERVPAVIYGRHHDPQRLELSQREIETIIGHSASEHIMVDLEVKDDPAPKRLALVQDIQHHPLTGAIMHVDFHEVKEDERVVMNVPIEPVGEPIGVKMAGATLEHVLFNVKVSALPKDLPEVIIVDVTHLEAGQTMHIGDVPLPDGVQAIGDSAIPVFSVPEPKKETEDAVEKEVEEAVESTAAAE